MRKSLVRKSIRATGLMALLFASPAVVSMQGCTDLSEDPTSAITPDKFYRNEAEVIGGLASVYSTMRGTLDQYYNLTQVSSDEHIVPTRGPDWFDNGRWLEIDRQDWEVNSTSGLDDINGAWNGLFTGVARANVVLAALENVAIANQAQVRAELRALRAFYYYLLMDLFGGVPIVTAVEIGAHPQATRAEVFAFIESELIAARADLPDSWPASQHGRFTKGAANAILASIYLNAQVFTGTVTTAGLTPGPAKWAEAIAAADLVINSPQYSLAADWRSNFRADNSTSPENILVVKMANSPDQGLNFVMRALHYNQFAPSPWNGFATIAEVYNAFDADDQRRQIFLEGQQVNQDPKSASFGQPVNDRKGDPLIFTTTISSVTNASEGEGVRILKWPPDPDHVAQENGNDFAYFRLAEMHLIKAEALNEQGGAGTAQAVGIINMLRARVFEPDKPITAVTQAQVRDAVLQERLFELTAEAKRRQDLIRHNKYTQMIWFNNPSAREPYRILMPIPRAQIETNPNLAQNPGY